MDKHPLFERIAEEELRGDLAYPLLTKATEEGQKVARNSGEVSKLCHTGCTTAFWVLAIESCSLLDTGWLQTWCSAYRRVRDSRNTDGVEDGVD